MRRSLDSRAEPDGSLAASVRLVVPERFVLDEIARHRLVTTLLDAPPEVHAVGAELAALEAGAGFRVDAEWRDLERSDPTPAASGSVRGAVAVRPGTSFRVEGDLVTIEDGGVLIDSGAAVHDPRTPFGAPTVASPRSRSPFPRRPIVGFLGLEPDEDREDWARRMVNRLVRRDIEARLLTPSGVPGGFHLTRPAAPDPASIAALGPDVIVALDPTAAARAPQWCTRRETVIVEYDPSATETATLVSWELSQARGRLRARIGHRIDAPRLADLVLRLCAGPQPAAPTDHPRPVAPSPTFRPTPAARRVVVVVPEATAPRALGLVDALAAARCDAHVVTAEAYDSGDDGADLVVLTDLGAPEAAAELVAGRRAAGRPTVCDLTIESLASDAPSAVIAPAVARLARTCGLVTAPPGAVLGAASTLGIPVLGVPTMPTRRRTAALIRARTERDPEATVIGWRPPAGDAITGAVAAALTRLLAAHRALRVEIVGGSVPAALDGADRVALIVDEPAAEAIANWTVHLWTPPLLAGEPIDDHLAVREAALAGVPTTCALAARAAVAGFTADALTATDPERPDDWVAVLGHLLEHPEARPFLAAHTVRRARTVYGPLWWELIANRLVGWATGPERDTP